jgi:hypothetical protein
MVMPIAGADGLGEITRRTGLQQPSPLPLPISTAASSSRSASFLERIHDVLEGLVAIATEDGKDLADAAAVTLETDVVVVTM